MSRQPKAAVRTASKFTTDDAGLAFTICFFGLLPVGLASGLMLMQIFGVWSY